MPVEPAQPNVKYLEQTFEPMQALAAGHPGSAQKRAPPAVEESPSKLICSGRTSPQQQQQQQWQQQQQHAALSHSVQAGPQTAGCSGLQPATDPTAAATASHPHWQSPAAAASSSRDINLGNGACRQSLWPPQGQHQHQQQQGQGSWQHVGQPPSNAKMQHELQRQQCGPVNCQPHQQQQQQCNQQQQQQQQYGNHLGTNAGQHGWQRSPSNQPQQPWQPQTTAPAMQQQQQQQQQQQHGCQQGPGQGQNGQLGQAPTCQRWPPQQQLSQQLQGRPVANHGYQQPLRQLQQPQALQPLSWQPGQQQQQPLHHLQRQGPQSWQQQQQQQQHLNQQQQQQHSSLQQQQQSLDPSGGCTSPPVGGSFPRECAAATTHAGPAVWQPNGGGSSRTPQSTSTPSPWSGSNNSSWQERQQQQQQQPGQDQQYQQQAPKRGQLQQQTPQQQQQQQSGSAAQQGLASWQQPHLQQHQQQPHQQQPSGWQQQQQQGQPLFQQPSRQGPQQPDMRAAQQHGAHTTPSSDPASGSGTTGPGRASSWRPSIWGRICCRKDLQSAVVSGAVEQLCRSLDEPACHVALEVERLKHFFNLTFPFRLVLDQFKVLDFVSSRTLQQLPELPCHQFSQLDTWLAEDLATYTAAAAAASRPGAISSRGSSSAVLSSGPITSWAKHCGCWTVAEPGSWGVRPSQALEAEIEGGRLLWVPHGTDTAAAAGGSGGRSSGVYKWQHGPVDAWLSNERASKAGRAAELQRKRHPRNQGRLLLNPAAYLPSTAGAAATITRNLFSGPHECCVSGSSSSGGPVSRARSTAQQALCGGCIDFRFWDLDHPASCHLQRHPVLGAHDRLIRVSIDKTTLGRMGGSSSNSSNNSNRVREQEAAAAQQALEDVLTHGVMLAGRVYQRLVQKDIGQDGESIWLLATDSVAPEDRAAWPSINPAAARQLLGGFSSLPSVSKQSARGALLVSNTLPLKVPAGRIMYIPDVQGPTDTHGYSLGPQGGNNNSQAAAAAATAAVCDESAVLTDGSGFISQDLAELIPAVSAGELLTGDSGVGVKWPHTPLQLRLFDPHFGGVIAKGTLLSLNSNALPPGTIILRCSQVKAPAGKVHWEAWTQHWHALLVWAHRQHQQNQRHQQQQGRQHLHQQQQHQQAQQAQQHSSGCFSNLSSSSGSSRVGGPAAAAVLTSPDAAVEAAKAAAAEAAAATEARRSVLRCFHAQDQPWMQQLWYIHDAQQLVAASQPATIGSSTSACMPTLSAVTVRPPAPCQQQRRQLCQQHSYHVGSGTAATTSTSRGSCSSCSTGSGSSSGSVSCVCCCVAALEVVNRPPDGSGRPSDLRINKNLLMLLHDAGVPQVVFSDWMKIEQHKLVNIDRSVDEAKAAAQQAGALDVVWKLEAYIGVKMPSAAVVVATGGHDIQLELQPDLALKQELHDIKVQWSHKLKALTLHVPTPQDAAAAAEAGVVAAPGDGSAVGTAAGGVRLFGLPDPTCGAVPEGWVAVRPELVPPCGRAIIYRDPGIHPGDVRRVRVMPYPPELLQLVPEGTGGAIFLPSVGTSSLAAALAGGDYDGDQFLLLWDERLLATFRQEDPPPYVLPSSSRGAGRWSIADDAGWELVERRLTEYHSFCLDVSGLMGEAHNLWELLADRQGAGSDACEVLAGIYYRALDAPKTGIVVQIPAQYAAELQAGFPDWHSRMVKEESRSAYAGGRPTRMCAAGRKRPWVHRSKIVRALWEQVCDLPPVDYCNTDLLQLDPDLVVQEGPDAVPRKLMQPFLDKWNRLDRDVWANSWRQMLQETPSSPSKAASRARQEEKADLRCVLVQRMQRELWTTGAEGLTLPGMDANGGLSVLALNLVMLNASACYQAVYSRAQEKQQRLAALTPEQRKAQAQRNGYEDMPRVAMAWRVAGDQLRVLKAQRYKLHMQIAQQQAQLDAARRGLCRVGAAGGRQLGLQLGAVQHPLAALLADQQRRQGAARRNRAPGVVGGTDWGGQAGAVAGLRGLALA